MTGLQIRNSISTATISMAKTPKNKFNKIWEEMGRDNKEVRAYDGLDAAAAFPLRVKNQVGSGARESRKQES